MGHDHDQLMKYEDCRKGDSGLKLKFFQLTQMKLDFYQILSGTLKSCQDLESDLSVLDTVEI